MLWTGDHPGLRREMGGIKAHLLPSGRTKYATNGLDFASCVVTLAHAVVADDFVPGNGDGPSVLDVNKRFAGASIWSGMRGRGFG